jgi:hypothetical protein
MPIAVVRAETYYLPARPLPADAWVGIPPAELVYAYVESRMGRRVQLPAGYLDDVPPVYARVDQNRWIADCVCGSAACVSPADPRWGCTECDYGWVRMVVPTPDEVAAIEAELMKQPRPHLRSWWNPADPSNPNPPVEEPEPPVEDPEPEQPQGEPAPASPKAATP